MCSPTAAAFLDTRSPAYIGSIADFLANDRIVQLVPESRRRGAQGWNDRDEHGESRTTRCGSSSRVRWRRFSGWWPDCSRRSWRTPGRAAEGARHRCRSWSLRSAGGAGQSGGDRLRNRLGGRAEGGDRERRRARCRRSLPHDPGKRVRGRSRQRLRPRARPELPAPFRRGRRIRRCWQDPPRDEARRHDRRSSSSCPTRTASRRRLRRRSACRCSVPPTVERRTRSASWMRCSPTRDSRTGAPSRWRRRRRRWCSRGRET